MAYALQGTQRFLGGRGRPRGPCPGYQQCETVQRRGDGIWRGTQHQVSFVDAAFPGMLPVINRRMCRAGGAHWPWA